MDRLQDKIGEVLDQYGLRNIRQLEDKIKQLKAREQRTEKDILEIKYLEFVLEAYNYSMTL